MTALLSISLMLIGVFLAIIIFDMTIHKSNNFRDKIYLFFSSKITDNTASAHFLFATTTFAVGVSYFIGKPTFTMHKGFPIHSYTNGFLWLFIGLHLIAKITVVQNRI